MFIKLIDKEFTPLPPSRGDNIPLNPPSKGGIEDL